MLTDAAAWKAMWLTRKADLVRQNDQIQRQRAQHSGEGKQDADGLAQLLLQGSAASCMSMAQAQSYAAKMIASRANGDGRMILGRSRWVDDPEAILCA